MSKTFLVAQREYLENLRTKTFWIGILMFPILLGVSILAPIWLDKVKDARRFAVIDRSGFLLEEVRESISVQDLQRLLNGFLPATAEEEETLKAIPAPVRSVLETVTGLGKEAYPEVAQFLVSGTREESSLPRETLASLEIDREPFLEWWNNLTPVEMNRLQKGLDRSRYHLTDYPQTEMTPERMNEKIQAGELFAYFEIGPDPVEGNEGCRYVSNNLTDRDLLNWFNGHASGIVKERRVASAGIDRQTAHWINQSLNFETNRVGASGEGEKVRAQDMAGQWAPVAFVYLLWISVFTVAQILLTNTIEEKSNRIIEVLLSSVSPFQLMSGKILGNALTGLTVIGSWIGFVLLGITIVPRFLERAPNVQLEQVVSEPLYLGSFIFYFLAGYFLYSALLVGIGSVCNNPKEAQNLMLPVMLILIVPLLSMMPVAQDPNGTLARTLSYIPFFTPFVMMNRAAGPPPIVDYVGTTLLLLVSVPLVFWAASRIFRIGVLMTGQPPSARQMIHWLFTESRRRD